MEMDGNGAQFVKRLWIGLDLGKAISLKRCSRYGTFIKHDISNTKARSYMGGGTGGGGGRGDRSPAHFSAFNIVPMDGAWKESTSNGPRPPSPSIVAPWRRPWSYPKNTAVLEKYVPNLKH